MPPSAGGAPARRQRMGAGWWAPPTTPRRPGRPKGLVLLVCLAAACGGVWLAAAVFLKEWRQSGARA